MRSVNVLMSGSSKGGLGKSMLAQSAISCALKEPATKVITFAKREHRTGATKSATKSAKQPAEAARRIRRMTNFKR